MRIGIFDSGVGGLSVLNEAYHRFPDQEYIFYADTRHVPYGTKSEEEIKGYVDEIVRFLISKDVDAIVIACNTATSVGASMVREKYKLPILGMEPAVKPAVEECRDDSKRILVMATPVTIREKKLERLLSRVDLQHKADLLEMPGLVKYAEREEFDTKEVRDYISNRFLSVNASYEKYSALVLGCTHFNYFKPLYRELLGDSIHLIDGNHGTINHLGDVMGLEVKNDEDKEIIFNEPQDIVVGFNTTYYESGDEITDNDRLSKYLRMLNRLEFVRKF
ncbi:glutamate racemase [Butyrivibrio sp. ob235]|uniref:glutamate racemase n=1 Tax=Butyrivibrio sp. ob235 TaxID=1761780 RepID=UPI0008AA7EF4|nr:glutamate racemase [Butyrivibrio sp. ob235]SEL65628.1 glutamate racemase [Butyrivibrio sp. ob235]